MLDLSSLIDKATELFNGTPAADLAESIDATQWLDNVGIDPADLGDLSAINTDRLLSNIGLDGEDPLADTALGTLQSKLAGE